MRIGVTDNFKPTLDLYIDWLGRGDPGIETIKLSHRLNNLQGVGRCDGLVLTGGGDVDPRRYDRADAVKSVNGVDADRDAFEFEAVRQGLRLGIPLLGICRGLQVGNVVLGGSLIPDLVSEGRDGHRQAGQEDARHPIALSPGTMLHEIIGADAATVNSSHHQAADRLGAGLRVSARSADNAVEALEWNEGAGKPFLLLVQWHPERMGDFENPASQNVLHRFLSEIRKFVEV